MIDLEKIRVWDFQSPFWANRKTHFLSNGDGPYALKYNVVTSALRPYRKEIRLSSGLILDIGSGALPAMYLPRGVRQRTVSLDISRNMLALNKSMFKVMADANFSLPFANESFGFVTMFFANRYIGDQDFVLNEVLRVLINGGRFIMLDFNTNNHPLEKAFFEPKMLVEKALSLGCNETSIQVLTEGNAENAYKASLFSGRKAPLGCAQRDSNPQPSD